MKKYLELVAALVIFIGLTSFAYMTEYLPAYNELERAKASYFENHITYFHPGCIVTTTEAASDCSLNQERNSNK